MDFKWKNEYELGIPKIDEQHRRLLEIGQEVYDVVCISEASNGAEDIYDDIMSILEKLYDYTEYHFKSEEEELSKVKYDMLDDHILEHEFFTKYLNKIVRKDIDENQDEHINDILEFLNKWLIHHIQKTDRDYVRAF